MFKGQINLAWWFIGYGSEGEKGVKEDSQISGLLNSSKYNTI